MNFDAAAPIAEDEPLARYLFSRHDFNASSGEVRWKAFEPRDRRTSSFRIRGLDEEGIWALGRDAGRNRPMSLKGRAMVTALDVHRVCLSVVQSPPARHADIEGWPVDPIEIQAAAFLLAKRAVLVTC